MFDPPISMVIYTRDWHPPNHCSFQERGGPWPLHCVQGTPGAEFHSQLAIVPDALVVDKGADAACEHYGGFEAPQLVSALRDAQIETCLICGLTTEYCVRETALGSVAAGFDTWVLTDAIAAVKVKPGDEQRALLEMRMRGVNLADSGLVSTILHHHHQRTALLIVDVQRDFCPEGSLAVADAPRIFEPIRRLIGLAQRKSIMRRLLESRPSVGRRNA